MASKEEVESIVELIHKNRPQASFNELHRQDIGIFAVIKYLREAPNEVTSAEISKFLGISSARMSVLIKKLENKELILKISSSNDKRLKVIKLTEKGNNFAEDLKLKIYKSAEKIIDEFGIDEVRRIFEQLNRFKMILEENAPSKINMEDFND